MPIDLIKMKKKQLVNLINSKDEDIQNLNKRINELELSIQENNKKVIEVNEELDITELINDIDKEKIKFYEERIKNSIYKDLVSKYQKELDRILNSYSF